MKLNPEHFKRGLLDSKRDSKQCDLYLGNCLEVLRDKVGSSTVDLVVTSPPYDNLRDYKGYSFDFELIARELARVLKPGGVIVWIVNDATVDGSETGTSFKQALYFKSIGLNLHDTMIWNKLNPVPQVYSKRYQGSFEFMFVFTKSFVKTHNPLMVPCLGAGKVCGSYKTISVKESKRRFTGNPTKELKVKGNVWSTSIGNNPTDHPAIFPIHLAHDHIKSWSNEGDLVLDPFLGSGTTGIAAALLDRRFIGIEIAKEYFDLAVNRIKLGLKE